MTRATINTKKAHRLNFITQPTIAFLLKSSMTFMNTFFLCVQDGICLTLIYQNSFANVYSQLDLVLLIDLYITNSEMQLKWSKKTYKYQTKQLKKKEK